MNMENVCLCYLLCDSSAQVMIKKITLTVTNLTIELNCVRVSLHKIMLDQMMDVCLCITHIVLYFWGLYLRLLLTSSLAVDISDSVLLLVNICF